MKRLHQLRKQQLDALQRSFPDGLEVRDALFVQATLIAETYFKSTYGVNQAWRRL